MPASWGATPVVDGLTMRRLAKEIGSTPMALYHHVRNKEELLVLLLDDYAARTLHRPALPADPRERVVAAATAIHDALASCPWIVEVLTADDLMSTSALWFVEQIVDGLAESGLSPEQAVQGYRAIWYYTAGEIVVRASAARRRAHDERGHLHGRPPVPGPGPHAPLTDTARPAAAPNRRPRAGL